MPSASKRAARFFAPINIVNATCPAQGARAIQIQEQIIWVFAVYARSESHGNSKRDSRFCYPPQVQPCGLGDVTGDDEGLFTACTISRELFYLRIILVECLPRSSVLLASRLTGLSQMSQSGEDGAKMVDNGCLRES